MIRFLRFCLIAMVLALPVAAQEAPGPDYKSWDVNAKAAEAVVTKATATDESLSQLRADIVKARNQFIEAQSANNDQIDTLKKQIAALGPAPAEGETEDPTIAARRVELNARLAKLQAPGITADEAASRADGLIRNIDRIMRDRQADKLLRLSPSAANPINWPAAVSLFRWMGAWIYEETVWRFTRPINYDTLRNNAPLIAGLVVVALLLLLRGGHWMERLTKWLLDKTAMRGRGLISGIVSLGQVMLPVLGAMLLAKAFASTAFFGPILMKLFDLLPWVLFMALAARWLGTRIFPPRSGAESALGLVVDRRTEGRLHALMMGLALGLQHLMSEWIIPRAQDYLGGSGNVGAEKAQEVALRADAAISVLEVPLQIFAALVLFRMGQILRRQKRLGNTQDADAAFRYNLLFWLGNAVIVISVITPVLGVIGYISAANALIWPALLSLGLLALLAVVQDFVTDLYVLICRGDESRREGLIPVLLGLMMSLASLPFLALIWGMRTEDLADLWTTFRNGISWGGVHISPAVFLTFAVVFAIGYMITRMVQGALRNSILPKTKIDKGGQNAIISGLGYIGIFLAAVLAISSAGIDLSSLAIVAGALSVGIGFGLQNIVSNFVSGIILLIERPISEGDWIEVGGQQGIVRAISVRSTRIETFNRTDVIVPNADLVSGVVTNWTRGNLTGRVTVPIGVAYGVDTKRVEKILLEIAHDHPLVMMNPEPRAYLVSFGANSVNFEIRAILSDVNFIMSVLSEMNHEIARRFAEEGIEIPFPQQDIWLRNPETLRTPSAAPQRDQTTAGKDTETPKPPL
ncbi:DUF3772 domain-containing protein [Phaeovulum sp.]|uniref:DUF3772 domain-containing protein n=1 Tax=Phaeovulum sp. TaxID=2934796 RepID=UPI0039E5EAC7